MRKTILYIVLLVLFLLSATAVRSQYYLGVIKGEARRIPIAVYDIYDEKGALAFRGQVLEILQADLRHSGIFDVMEPKKLDIGYSSTAEPSVELVKRAGTFGLTGVAWATVRSKGKEIMLAGKLYDAAGGSRLLSREYFGNEETLRRTIHSFADDVVTQYTGEKGIARTRIAYVSDKT